MNSTIIRKKRKLSCGCFDYAFSKNRCKQHATIESTQKRIEKQESNEEQESWTNLRDDLDAIFSRYIRIKHADKDGYVTCFTSGKRMRWEDSHCGHYISRSNMATRWDEKNCKVQSPHDNCILYGNLEVFKANLEKEKIGITLYLEDQSRQVCKPTIEDLKQLIAEYRHKLKLAQTKFK